MAGGGGAASERLGKREIPVEVREGSREDAWVYAATANFRNGRNLTLLERDRAIERVVTLRPDWTQDQIARQEFKVDPSVVSRAVKAFRLQRDLGRGQETAQTYAQRNLAGDREQCD